MSEKEKRIPYAIRFSLTILAVTAITFLGYLEFVAYLKNLVPAFFSYSLYLLSVAAGVATFFSPCSFPLLPGFLALHYDMKTTSGSKDVLFRGVLAAAGVVSFTILLGIVIAVFGQGVAVSLSLSGPNPNLLTRVLRFVVGIVLVSLGVVQLSRATLHSDALEALTSRFYRATRSGNKGLYLYGFGYNAASIGCAGPIMGGLVVFALASGDFVSAFFAFLTYSLTMASLMLGVSLLVAKSKALLVRTLKHSTSKIKKASSVVLLTVGAFLVYATVEPQFFLQTFFP